MHRQYHRRAAASLIDLNIPTRRHQTECSESMATMNGTGSRGSNGFGTGDEWEYIVNLSDVVEAVESGRDGQSGTG